jgi:hypothetical protein
LIRVLIVEDEESLADPLAYLLRKEGFEGFRSERRVGRQRCQNDIRFEGLQRNDKLLQRKSVVHWSEYHSRLQQCDTKKGRIRGVRSNHGYGAADLQSFFSKCLYNTRSFGRIVPE